MKTHAFTLVVKTADTREDARLAVLTAFAGRAPDGCQFQLQKKSPRRRQLTHVEWLALKPK